MLLALIFAVGVDKLRLRASIVRRMGSSKEASR